MPSGAPSPKGTLPAIKGDMDDFVNAIAQMTKRLRIWCETVEQGMARIEYVSAKSRDRIIQELSAALSPQTHPTILLKKDCSPADLANDLVAQLEKREQGVVHVLGFGEAFPEDTHTAAQYFGALNLVRERLAVPGIRQIWWMPRHIATLFTRAAPDLESWFLLKNTVDAIPPASFSDELLAQDIDAPATPSASAEALYKYAIRQKIRAEKILSKPQKDTHDFETAADLYCEAAKTLEKAYFLPEAKEAYLTAIEICKNDLGDRHPNLVELLNGLGRIAINIGEPAKAIVSFEQSLEIARELGAARALGNALGNLGVAYYNLGKLEKALKYLSHALLVFREIGDQHGEGSALVNLGLISAKLGNAEKAIENYEQSLEIARGIRNRNDEKDALGNLGNIYFSLGEIQKAFSCYEQTLSIARELGDRHSEGSTLGNTGVAYGILGETEKAIENFEQALEIFCEIGAHRDEGNTLNNLANALSKFGRHGEAIRCAEEALAIFEQTESPRVAKAREQLEALRKLTK